MKSMLGMAMMMASLGSSGFGDGSKMYSEPKESDEQRKKRLEDAEIARKKRQGLKEFKYSGGTVWALRQKTADDKARKKNWL